MARKKLKKKVSKKLNNKKNIKLKRKPTKKKSRQVKKKVTAVPKNYNNVTAYLIVDNAEQAIDFYKSVFNAKVVMRMDMPNKKIAHAELKIGDSKVMLADESPDMSQYGPRKYSGSAVSIHLYIKNVDAVIENSVKKGAELIRPAQDMFYGDRTGTIKDPFGHQWHIATHIEDVTPAQTRKRAEALFNKQERTE